MLKGMLMTAVAAAVALGVGYADQSKPPVVIGIQKNAPLSGKLMYASYCAPCHGADGRGNGPVAPALKHPPIDLTALSKNNKGKFPAAHISSVLQYGSEISAHGTPEMPVWGPLLSKMSPGYPGESMLRINNLSHFLETIQVK
jgi:mono/diheme cytochrome c family protein